MVLYLNRQARAANKIDAVMILKGGGNMNIRPSASIRNNYGEISDKID